MSEEKQQHARLSASSAERFINCPGSVALAELLPPEEESEYAAEGTAAHELAQLCLEEGSDAFMFAGQKLYKGHEVTGDMIEAVQEYVDYVREMAGDAELIIEQTIDDPELGADFGGTSDAVAHRVKDGGGFIHVFDYKHGAGIAVEIGTPENFNKQLGYYAFGVLRILGIKRGDDINVGLTIVQPRAFHSEGSIREVWVSSDDIIAWGEDVLIPAMARVDSDDTPFSAGEHCRFCPGKVACPVLQENFEEMSSDDTGDIPGYSDEELADKFAKIQSVKFMIKAIEAECKRRALAGNAVGGTKLVYGRSTRQWKKGVEDKILELFGDDTLTDPQVKTPAQIEKLPGGKDFAAEHSYKEKGRPNIVSADARGEPYDASKEGEGFKAVSIS